jgi:hypothetical protein
MKAMSEDLKILAEDIVDFCNAAESACVKLRLQIEKLLGREVKARIPEERFNFLKWQEEKGSRLGDFQVAYAKLNVPESYSHAFNVLKANNSFIANPFHEEGYEFGYWIYPQKYSDRIFRKRLSEA